MGRIIGQIEMFVLLWVALLSSWWDSHAEADAPVLGQPYCFRGFCVQHSEGQITAEAGLCAVIHCSFSTPSYFDTSALIWYKCEAGQRCTDSDVIFHSKNKNKVQSSFAGRVSLLEPDLNQRNCSIIINDLDLSDSGSYQLQIHSNEDRWRFNTRAFVSVKVLQQKPTVRTPALTEGQQASLTCTAPGLCSGSEPNITWTWRRAGEKAPPTIATATTDSLTDVHKRHSSTLEFTPSAELQGTELTCTVSFPHQTTEETVTMNVTYVKNITITGNTFVKEGDSLNVSCSVDSFPPSLVKWYGPFNKTNLNIADIETEHQILTEIFNQTELGSASLIIFNVTEAHSGQYVCAAQHLSRTRTREINLSVIYLREPVIVGETSVEEGSALSLTCRVDSFPPSNITLRKVGTNTNVQNETEINQTDSGSATLVISNMTQEDAGQYKCTAQHELQTLTAFVDVKMLWKPEMMNTSGCVYQSEVLTCVCISRGSPVPTVTWSLLEDHTEYSVVTMVTGHTVNSTFVLRVKDLNRTEVQCVSSNRVGRVQESFRPSIRTDTADPQDMTSHEKIIKVVSTQEVIIAFVSGFVLSAVLCCLIMKCRRRKQKSDIKDRDMTETLEMVNSQEDSVVNGHAAEVANANAEPEELHYASIDFSALKGKGQRNREKKEETPETEYAEIKREILPERQENGKVPEEMPEDREEEAMMVEDDERKQSVPEEEMQEEVALYSNVKEIMADD